MKLEIIPANDGDGDDKLSISKVTIAIAAVSSTASMYELWEGRFSYAGRSRATRILLRDTTVSRNGMSYTLAYHKHPPPIT
jgi:hypothetical protein